MRIVADRDKCIASGACVLACPEVFDQDEDGLVVILNEHPGADLHDRVVEAIRDCPAAVLDLASEPTS